MRSKVLATMLMVFFVLAILSPVIPVGATVSGTISIVEHKADLVAPGGAVQIDATDLSATGGTVYFYLSTEKSGETEAGDIYVTSMDKEDVVGELVTLWVPSTIAKNETYYVKVTDVKGTGKNCVASSESFDTATEWPTVTTDPVDGNVGDYPEIDAEGADDYETFEFYWDEYNDAVFSGDVVDGEFKVNEEDVEEYPIPNGFEGSHIVIVLFIEEDGDTLSTAVEFKIKPNIEVTPPEDFSVEAEATIDQDFSILGSGFPEGTVDEDSIDLIVKDFKTGETIDTYNTLHDETDVMDEDPDKGVLEIDPTTLEEFVEAGVITLKITVDGKVKTFEDISFYASTPTDPEDFTKIEYAKVSETEGYIGDEITFSFINLPAGADISIDLIGPAKKEGVVTGAADGNGAWEGDYELADIPGGEYAVWATVEAVDKKIGTFKVLPKLEVWDLVEDEALEEIEVGDEIGLKGTGFPVHSTISTSLFASEEVDVLDADTETTGVFLIELDEDENALKVPHISGGGKSVTVTVKGEDSEGEDIKAEISTIVNPKLLEEDLDEDEDGEIDWEVGVLEWDTAEEAGAWIDFAGADIFPGNPVKVVGFGYLADESVTVKLYDGDDLIGTATITSGEKADSSGDLELVCLLPAVKDLWPGGYDNLDVKIAGSTTTNTAAIEEVDIRESSDDAAKLFFGLEDDGDLDTEVNVGDTVRVVACGFRTKSTLTLKVGDTELKSVKPSNGYFDTTIVIPEKEGSWDPDAEKGEKYTLVAVDTDIEREATFWLRPKITLDPSEAYEAEKVTVKGTGFNDGEDVDIVWVGVAEEETLDTVDAADIEDGSFAITVDVPKAVAQSYRIKAVRAGEEWADATFTVLDVWRVQIGQKITDLTTKIDSLSKTIQDLSAAVAGLDPAAITRAIEAVKSDVSALKTTADALKTDVAAAKAAASDAKSAASDAKATASEAASAASDASSAASNAATAASDAKAAAQAAQSTAAGISTAAYGAMVLALVAAIFAIVAVVQLQRKVAG